MARVAALRISESVDFKRATKGAANAFVIGIRTEMKQNMLSYFKINVFCFSSTYIAISFHFILKYVFKNTWDEAFLDRHYIMVKGSQPLNAFSSKNSNISKCCNKNSKKQIKQEWIFLVDAK